MNDQSVLLFAHIGGKTSTMMLYESNTRERQDTRTVPARRITLRAELDSYVLLSKSNGGGTSAVMLHESLLFVSAGGKDL